MINKKRRTRTVEVLPLILSACVMTKKSGEKTGRNNEINQSNVSFNYTAGQKFEIIKSFNVFNGEILTKAAFI